jgi:hypothetical protein
LEIVSQFRDAVEFFESRLYSLEFDRRGFEPTRGRDQGCYDSNDVAFSGKAHFFAFIPISTG